MAHLRSLSMRLATSRKALLAALATPLLLMGLGAGSAFAYLTSHGSGSGSASSGTVTLTLSVTAGSGLYPGGSSAVTVKLNNTSPSASLSISSLAQNGTTTIQTAGKGSCDPTVVTFTAGSLPANPISAGSYANVSGTVSMTTTASDGCQGTVFSIPLQATGRTS